MSRRAEFLNDAYTQFSSQLNISENDSIYYVWDLSTNLLHYHHAFWLMKE